MSVRRSAQMAREGLRQPETMDLADCTIIMPTRNRPSELAVTAARLVESGLSRVPVIVVDDASDDPAAVRASLAPLENCCLIPREVRTGQAGARNVGLRRAATRYCLFLDDDSHPDNPGALADFLASPAVGDAAVWRFELVRQYDGYRDGIPESLPLTRFHTFIGYGVLMDRRAALDVGGYRDYFCYRHEEDDLAVRLFRAGHTIMYRPGIRFIHRHTPAARNRAEYFRLSTRNVFLLHALNWPLPIGVPLGLAKAAAFFLRVREHRLAQIGGMLAGPAVFARRFATRTPLTFAQAAAYRQLRTEVLRRIAAPGARAGRPS